MKDLERNLKTLLDIAAESKRNADHFHRSGDEKLADFYQDRAVTLLNLHDELADMYKWKSRASFPSTE